MAYYHPRCRYTWDRLFDNLEKKAPPVAARRFLPDRLGGQLKGHTGRPEGFQQRQGICELCAKVSEIKTSLFCKEQTVAREPATTTKGRNHAFSKNAPNRFASSCLGESKIGPFVRRTPLGSGKLVGTRAFPTKEFHLLPKTKNRRIPRVFILLICLNQFGFTICAQSVICGFLIKH